MLSNLAIGYVIAGILAVIGGAVRQYLAYRDGRKTEKVIQQNAVLKATLEMHKTASDVESQPAPDNFDDIANRL